MKIFSAKFEGVAHPPMIGFKQSMKVFSMKFSLPTDLRKCSPSNVYHYTVQMADCGCAFYASVPEQELGQLISPRLYMGD